MNSFYVNFKFEWFKMKSKDIWECLSSLFIGLKDHSRGGSGILQETDYVKKITCTMEITMSSLFPYNVLLLFVPTL